MLKVRALVITPQENTEMYIKFASICRKAQRAGLAEKSLNSLLGTTGPITSPQSLAKVHDSPYSVQYAVYKFLWSNGYHDGALSALRDFTNRLRGHFLERNASLSAGVAQLLVATSRLNRSMRSFQTRRRVGVSSPT